MHTAPWFSFAHFLGGYLQKVQEVCGFDVPLQDEVDDAKN